MTDDNQQATVHESSTGQGMGGPSTGSLFKKRGKKASQNQTRKRTIDAELLPTSNHDDNDKDKDQENLGKKSKLAHDQSKNPEQQPVVKFSRRKNRRNHNPLYHATGGKTRRTKVEQSGSSSEEEESEDSEGDGSTRRRVGVAYQAQGSARQQAEESYQKSLLEKRELSEQARQAMDTELPLDPPPSASDPKLYLGTANSKYQLPKGSQKYGPIKGGPNNIKTITVVDYQPDVCKDYKETGYCGFGDTYDAFNSSRNQQRAGREDSESEEEVPLICRQPFNDPIVTKCKHYFCSGCAIKRFAKTPKCFACGTPTGGIFNKASRIIEKMNAKQDRIKRQKEERKREEDGLAGIEGLETQPSAGQDPDDGPQEGSERSFYEDE
ncbi:hypothetical protein VP01_385g6 [Puccinia sorghi]|uniref:Pre-mRNA-splicing factor CWC24 n=1 Tax=Puccinia sorghi TaxID=27349 RepID=A0A0L6UTW5_9BASI|nr:hypothetical protein VP01_385g6 [Puccinia sorghi]